jgi:hypothetical protein
MHECLEHQLYYGLEVTCISPPSHFMMSPNIITNFVEGIFPSKTWFFWNLFEFSVAGITEKSMSHILNPNFTK